MSSEVIEKKIKCPYCPKKFKSTKDLEQHKRDVHSKESKEIESIKAEIEKKQPVKIEVISENPTEEEKPIEKGKMNDSEAKFKEWLDHQGYNFYFLDQTTSTQSEQFKTIASRPDFAIKLADDKLIYVDVKEKHLYTETETFTFYKETHERLSTFEEKFSIPVWIAISTKQDAFRIWHFISINKIKEKGVLSKDKDDQLYYIIDLKKCYTFGWKDALDKILSKVDELKEIPSDFTKDLMLKLDENDNELKKLKRERRKDKKELQREIDEIKENYLVKPSVKLKQIQKEVNEIVSENVKKMKEGFKKTFKRKSEDEDI